MRKFSVILTVFLTFLLAAPAARAATNDGPVYPDLWERDIPLGIWDDQRDSVFTYERPDGEPAIAFKTASRRGSIGFFSGRLEEGRESYETAQSIMLKDIPTRIINIPRGPTIMSNTNYDEDDCYDGFNAELYAIFSTYNPYHSDFRSYEFIVYLDKPRHPPHYPGAPDCEAAKSFHSEQVFAVPFLSLFRLKDDSFLALSIDLKKAFRFRKDISSPIIDNKRYFLIPKEEFYEIVKIPGNKLRTAKSNHDKVKAYLDKLREDK